MHRRLKPDTMDCRWLSGQRTDREFLPWKGGGLWLAYPKRSGNCSCSQPERPGLLFERQPRLGVACTNMRLDQGTTWRG